ncbi:hypothetical protein GPALN_007842 [Globodera pallida]|nr:hypothetical protein GPALN_007842 [Globodera pallida]
MLDCQTVRLSTYVRPRPYCLIVHLCQSVPHCAIVREPLIRTCAGNSLCDLTRNALTTRPHMRTNTSSINFYVLSIYVGLSDFHLCGTVRLSTYVGLVLHCVREP